VCPPSATADRMAILYPMAKTERVRVRVIGTATSDEGQSRTDTQPSGPLGPPSQEKMGCLNAAMRTIKGHGFASGCPRRLESRVAPGDAFGTGCLGLRAQGAEDDGRMADAARIAATRPDPCVAPLPKVNVHGTTGTLPRLLLSTPIALRHQRNFNAIPSFAARDWTSRSRSR
jgi:hypothetical protein